MGFITVSLNSPPSKSKFSFAGEGKKKKENAWQNWPFPHATPRTHHEGLIDILSVGVEFRICVLEPALRKEGQGFDEIFGEPVSWFWGDAYTCLVGFQSWFLFCRGELLLTPTGIKWPQTTTSGRSTSRGTERGPGGCRRRASWMTAWR